MIIRKSKVKSQRSEPATCDFRLATSALHPATSSLQPATCDFRLSTNKGAFTLVELVIVIVLLALTAGITTHYLVSASRLYVLLLAKKQADSEVVDAVSRMRREARLHVQTIAANSNEWKFSNINNATNTFSWDGADVNFNSNCLAAGVGRFAFKYYNVTNGQLPFPVTNCASIGRVALDIKATNNLAVSELKINFFMQDDLLK